MRDFILVMFGFAYGFWLGLFPYVVLRYGKRR